MPFADLHCDTISRLLAARRAGLPWTLRDTDNLHINLNKLHQSGYLLQNFALFVHLKEVASPWAEVLALTQLYTQELSANEDLISPVRTFDDLDQARQAGKIAAVLTVEEGGVCEGDPARLRTLHRLGVRMLTLTWNDENGLAAPNGKPGGLTDTGRAFLTEMEALSIIPDISHLGDDGFWEVCHRATRPFVASHSNCRALWDHRRNLTDEMIRALADRGGIVGVNFYAHFLGPGNTSRLTEIVRHLRHMIDVGGLACAALGSDFDGIDCPLELGDAGHMDRLVQALDQAGFTPREIDAVCWNNVWNFYRDTL